MSRPRAGCPQPSARSSSISGSRRASSRSRSVDAPAGAGEAAVELDGDAVAFDAAGVDQVVYRLAPNAGEPFRPLARIASGGELSRVALAIKQVLAEADDTPTLVFDEVDTGIGGRSADPVGRSLWTLARRHQVLCVTHLPQIAAHADAQFRISKRERDGRTVTEVERLDREGRIVELSQMLGERRRGRGGSGRGTGAARPGRGMAGSVGDGRMSPPGALEAAIDEYLSHLAVERGLSAATVRAYRTDLTDFARSEWAAEWDRSADPAVAYLASRARRGQPGEPGLAPTSLRRRAAALKGFYRFAYGEGLITVDVAAHLDLPRQSRLLPETLTVAETEALLEAAGGDDPAEPAHARRLRDRALLELLYAAGLRVSEAVRLDAEDLSMDGGFRAGHRQG